MSKMLEQDQNPDQPYLRTNEKLPEKNLRVIVICRNCRCLGYLDDNGVWRRHYGGDELDDVIGWLP